MPRNPTLLDLYNRLGHIHSDLALQDKPVVLEDAEGRRYELWWDEWSADAPEVKLLIRPAGATRPPAKFGDWQSTRV